MNAILHGWYAFPSGQEKFNHFKHLSTSYAFLQTSYAFARLTPNCWKCQVLAWFNERRFSPRFMATGSSPSRSSGPKKRRFHATAETVNARPDYGGLRDQPQYGKWQGNADS